MNETNTVFYEHLVIGSGLAGLTSALMLAEKSDGKIAVVTKGKVEICNSRLAQGGIACVLDEGDSFDEHLADTLTAGDHLCNAAAVREIVEAGPEKIRWLRELGTHFTTRGEVGDQTPDHQDEFHLGREGGHHKRRVIHAGDITGENVHNSLIAACRDNPQITILEDHAAIDLITSRRLGWIGDDQCLGAYILDANSGEVKTFVAYSVIVATGGAGKVYLYTSNSDIACGSGVAMCSRAFVPVANMEFFQFHPTVLYHRNAKSFLISEALRGEGGILKVPDAKGNLVTFMENYHEMASLAPRDVVARAIDNELKRRGVPCAYLDMTAIPRDFLVKRFPNIFEKCMAVGVDMSKQPIPVVPAAHYCCGGVKTDVNGFTGIKGLYVCGEAGCTGLHGANRLASNSLLEALVVPDFAAKHIMENYEDLKNKRPGGVVPVWHSGQAKDSDEQVVIEHNWEEIRRFMWDYVGIVRTNKRLERAKARVSMIRHEIDKYYWDFRITRELIELRNLATVAELIIDSALERKESRGLHYNSDYPERNAALDGVDTVITRRPFRQ